MENISSDDIVTKNTNGCDTVDHTDCTEDLKYNLFIHLKCAKNLPMRANKITKSNKECVDSFVKIVLGQKVVYKTKTIVKDSNPSWDETFMMVLPNLSSNVEIKVNHE